MIEYFFIVDNSSNSIVFAKPKENQDRFKNTMGLISSKVKFATMIVKERFESKYESSDLLLQKMSATLLFGCFVKNVGNRKGPLYQMFTTVFSNLPDTKTIKQNLKFKELVKAEIADYNSGKRDTLKRISKLSDQAESKVQKELERQMANASKLVETSEQLEDVLVIAKENTELASSVRTESWIYNMRMQLFLYGSTALLIGLGVLFFIKIVL